MLHGSHFDTWEQKPTLIGGGGTNSDVWISRLMTHDAWRMTRVTWHGYLIIEANQSSQTGKGFVDLDSTDTGFMFTIQGRGEPI